MSLKDLTSEEIDVLENALHVLTEVEAYFVLRDKTNAKLHLAGTKFSPITKATTKATAELFTLLAGSEPESIESLVGIEEDSS